MVVDKIGGRICACLQLIEDTHAALDLVKLGSIMLSVYGEKMVRCEVV